MSDLPTVYLGKLAHADILRQLFRHERAVETASTWAQGADGIALLVRVLRGQKLYRRANDILLDLPSADDTIALRENRFIVAERLGNTAQVQELQENLESVFAKGGGRAHRILVAIARHNAGHGELNRAQNEIQGAIENPPLGEQIDAIAYSWRLQYLLRLGDLAVASSFARGLADHDDWRVRAVTAAFLPRVDQAEKALEILYSVTEQNPGYPTAWRRLIGTLRILGQFAEARRVAERAAAQVVDLPPVAAHAGELVERVPLANHPLLLVDQAQLELARYDGIDQTALFEAERLADAALSMAPYCSEAWWLKAKVLRSIGDPAALARLRRLSVEESSQKYEAMAQVEYAHALADVGRWDRANDRYKAILSEHARNREARLAQITLLAKQTPPVPNSDAHLNDEHGPLGAAVRDFATVLREDSVMLCLGGERLAQHGHYADAHRLFGAASAIRPDNPLSRAGTIRAYGWARRFDDVGKYLDGDQILVGLAHAMTLADRGDIIGARSLFRTLAERVGPRSGQDGAVAAAVWYSTILRSTFQHDRAQEVLERVLAAATGHAGLGARGADVHDELGWNWFDRHHYIAAEHCFRAALALSPSHIGALRGMIQVFRALGNVSMAQKWVATASALHPQDASIQLELAWLHGEANQFGPAQAALEAALSREVAHAAALEWRILYLMREGRKVEVKRAAAEALAYRPESPSITEAACIVPLDRGDWAMAISTARDACARYRGDHKFAIMAASVCDVVSTTGLAPNWPSPDSVDVSSATEFLRDKVVAQLEQPEIADLPEVVAALARMRRLRRTSSLSVERQPRDGDIDTALPRRWWARLRPSQRSATGATDEAMLPSAVSDGPRSQHNREDDEMRELPEVRIEHAEFLLVSNRPTEAIQELEALCRRLPWSTRIVQHYTTILVTQGQLWAARRVADEAVRRAMANGDPRPVELLLLRGELSLRANDTAAALKDADLAVEHSGRSFMTARILQLRCHWALGAVDAGYRLALVLRSKRPASRQAKVALARSLSLMGRGFEAAELMTPSERILAHNQPSIVVASSMHRSVGAAAVTARYIEEARRMMPDQGDVLAEYAWTMLDLGRHDLATHALSELAEFGSPLEQAVGRTGQLWCMILFASANSIGDTVFRNQLSDTAKSVSTATTVAEAHYGGSVCFLLLANTEASQPRRREYLMEALRLARIAAEIDDISACHRLAGRILYELGSINSAKEHLERSVKLSPYRGDYAGLSLIQLSQGDHELALKTVEKGLRNLADGRSDGEGLTSATTHQVDLYAANGAIYLDQDLRTGKPGPNTQLALRYLRQAVDADQRHPFAIDNLATALAFTGAAREAVEILQHAIARIEALGNPQSNHSSSGMPSLDAWFDRGDVIALRERLIEILRSMGAHDGVGLRRRLMLRHAESELARAIEPRPNVVPAASTKRLTGPSRARAHIRHVGWGVATFAGLVLAWSLWSISDHDTIKPSGPQVALTTFMAMLVLVGLLLPSIPKLRFGGVEVEMQLSPSVDMLDLPTRISPHIGFGRIDAAQSQWTSMWNSESRLHRLGPTVPGLINGYYSHRDQLLPWRRR